MSSLVLASLHSALISISSPCTLFEFIVSWQTCPIHAGMDRTTRKQLCVFVNVNPLIQSAVPILFASDLSQLNVKARLDVFTSARLAGKCTDAAQKMLLII